MSSTVEGALSHSAECTARFLCWALHNEVQPKGEWNNYRKILLEEPCWAFEYAHQSKNEALKAEIELAAADNRLNCASAASWYLFRRPREPAGPYRDILRSRPEAVYWALPYVHGRGFTLGASDTRDPKLSYHLALSRFSCNNGNYLPALRRDPVWLVAYLLARHDRIDSKLARETAARLKDEHPEHPLLQRALTVLAGGPTPAIPPVLASGRQAELSALGQLHRSKNRAIYRPSAEQIESAEFKRIVGPPRYTERGYAKGTVMDIADGEFAEIKSGSSPLEPTYQLRLQAFRAQAEKRPLRIYTNRPVSPRLKATIAELDVAFEPLPE